MDFEEFDDVVWRDFFASSVVRHVRKFQLQNFWRLFHEKLSDNNFFFEFFKGFPRILRRSEAQFFLPFRSCDSCASFNFKTSKTSRLFHGLLTSLSWETTWQIFFFEFFDGFPRTLRCSLTRFFCFFGSVASCATFFFFFWIFQWIFERVSHLGSSKSFKEYYYEPVEQRSGLVRCTYVVRWPRSKISVLWCHEIIISYVLRSWHIGCTFGNEVCNDKILNFAWYPWISWLD